MRLFAAEVDTRGQPVLINGEIQRAILRKADLEFANGVGGVEGRLGEAYEGGYAILTNFRIIWASYSTNSAAHTGGSAFTTDGHPCHVPLASIATTELTTTFLQLKPPRVKVHVRLNNTGYPSSDPLAVARVAKLRIVAHKDATSSSGVDLWHSQLQQAIERRAWTAAPSGLLQQLHTPPPAPIAAQRGPMTPPLSYLLQQSLSMSGFEEPSGTLVQALCDMGFSEGDAREAARATRNTGVSEAVTWMLERSTGDSGASGRPHEATSGDINAQVSSQPQPTVPANVIPVIGVAGILQRQEQRAADRERTLDESLSDLSQLMAKAGEMVHLAQYFRDRARGRNDYESSAVGARGTEEDSIDEQLAAELADLGIASPVTRETAGKLYYAELSRQLGEFLSRGPVKDAGGMLPLAEAYRLFCRARFTDLLSPDDLLQASRLLPEVGSPLRLQEFPSGTKVIAMTGHDMDSGVQKVAELAVKGVEHEKEQSEEVQGKHLKQHRAPWSASLGPGVTRTEAASALQIPLAIAAEHLLAAEGRGLLCRDVGPEGVRWYKNFFAEITVPAL